MSGDGVVVTIASLLEPKLMRRIELVDHRLDVRYSPDLLPEAEVLFGLPGTSGEGLADAVRSSPRLRFIQATKRGADERVRAAALSDEEVARVSVTSAEAVHAGPLAEFAIFGILAFAKGLPRPARDKAAQCWDRYPMAELAGSTMLIVGLGEVGVEVARLAKAFGMRVVGVSRDGRTDSQDVDEVRTSRFLGDLLPVAHSVVLTLPVAEETEGMIGATAFARMRTGATVVNIGSGDAVDEAALVHALEKDLLAGAVLDPIATEPPASDSALWGLPNVLVRPHAEALSAHEDERMVALFCENLRHYLSADDLLSPVHPTLHY